MNSVKRIALAASVIAALGFTNVYAATENSDTQAPEQKPAVIYQDKDQNPNGVRDIRRRGPGDSFKVLAELTGKDATEIQAACRKDRIMPAQYANKIGKYKEYKAKRLALMKERLDKAVKDGKITKAKEKEALKMAGKRMDDQRDGKRMMPPPGVLPNEKGPQGDVLQVLNPDGSVAQGHEGMAVRENPMYGKMPFDTLSKLTGRTSQDLYAEAYKEKLTGAAMAKKLGIFNQYKAERLATHKAMMDKAVADGKMTQEQEDKMLTNLGKRIDDGLVEHRMHMNPRFSPMHPGPVVPPQR
jgi:hypothetical protein